MNELILELKKLQDEKDILDEKITKIKDTLQTDYLHEEGYKDDIITISYIKASKSTSIDLKQLELKEPILYNDLLNDYPKVTSRKASYKYTFK